MGTLLAIADFRKVWAVGALSGVVRWLEMLAFAVYVFDVTNSPFLVALVSLLRILPLALFGAPMGALADRLDRRGEPCWTPVAGPGPMAQAMALDASTSSLTRAMGPVTGGILITFLGFPGALLLGAGIYAVAIAFMLVLPRPKPETWAGEQGLWRNLQEGLAYAVSDRRVDRNGDLQCLGLPLYRDDLDLGPFNVGLLASMEGVGAFIGAMGVAFLGRATAHGRIIFFGAAPAGAGLILFALSPWPLLSGMILVATGIWA